MGEAGVSNIRNKPRAILTKELAREIYQYKLENMQVVASAVGRHACILASKYGVSEKTIRDVWTARTWSEETDNLDQERRIHGAADFTLPECRTTASRLVRELERTPLTSRSSYRVYRRNSTSRKSQGRLSEDISSTKCEETLEMHNQAQHAMEHILHGACTASDFDDPFHHDWPHWKQERENQRMLYVEQKQYYPLPHSAGTTPSIAAHHSDPTTMPQLAPPGSGFPPSCATSSHRSEKEASCTHTTTEEQPQQVQGKDIASGFHWHDPFHDDWPHWEGSAPSPSPPPPTASPLMAAAFHDDDFHLTLVNWPRGPPGHLGLP